MVYTSVSHAALGYPVDIIVMVFSKGGAPPEQTSEFGVKKFVLAVMLWCLQLFMLLLSLATNWPSCRQQLMMPLLSPLNRLLSGHRLIWGVLSGNCGQSHQRLSTERYACFTYVGSIVQPTRCSACSRQQAFPHLFCSRFQLFVTPAEFAGCGRALGIEP